MFRTFNIGILLGVAMAAALLYFVPAVDQHREPSLISVKANGGNTESFHINLPSDRIMLGVAGPGLAVPAALEWPTVPVLANARTELFKIRDDNDVVVGVASRIAGSGASIGALSEWTLHLPARGTLYLVMQPVADAAAYRKGTLRAGTREFRDMQGYITERFVGIGADSSVGRIELTTALVGIAGDDE